MACSGVVPPVVVCCQVLVLCYHDGVTVTPATHRPLLHTLTSRAVATFGQRFPGEIQPDNPTQNFLSEHGVAVLPITTQELQTATKRALPYQKTNIRRHYLRLGNAFNVCYH